MPIVDLTDQDTLTKNMRLPLVGTLNKGAPKPTDRKGAGRELPYFRFESDREGAKEVFAAAFGKEPKTLHAALPYPTLEQNFESWIECYNPGNGRMLWRSDGVKSVYVYDEEERQGSTRAQDQLSFDDLPHKEWATAKGRLFLYFRCLIEAGYAGPVMLRTSGIFDIAQIAGALETMRVQFEDHGGRTLEYAEVTLWRAEVERADPNGKKWKHWDVRISQGEMWVQAQLEAARQEMLAQLPANIRVIDESTGEVIYDREESDGYSEHAEPETVVRRDESVGRDRTASVPSAPPAQANPVPQARTKTGKVIEGKAAKVRLASVSGCADWPLLAGELADEFPFYMGMIGPDFAKMTQIAWESGFEKITNENIADVIAALELHATTESSVAAAQEGESF